MVNWFYKDHILILIMEDNGEPFIKKRLIDKFQRTI